jgi:iron complex outermembrane recepter protein
MASVQSKVAVGLSVSALFLAWVLLSPRAGVAAEAPEEAPGGGGTLAEVIVTAQKRSANLQDVPFSVSATSESQIRDSGSENIVDLSRNIAGFAVADLGPGQSQVAIRGISSGQVIRDQPGLKEQVGVYLDESPISVALFTPDLELFDIDRFEVLRGPQGTLFGAGSEAGTVRYITRQPQLGKYESITDASFEQVEHGDQGGSVRSAVNLPLGNTLAARLDVYWHHLPGFIDAIQPGGGLKKDVNDGDRTGVRLAFLFKPSQELSITPRIVYQNLSTNGFPRVDWYNILANPYAAVNPVTIGPLEQYTQQREGLLDQFTLTDLKADYNFGPMSLTSITSYTHRNVRVLRDATQLTGSVTVDLLPNDPNIETDARINSPLYDRTGLNVISEEIRLASNGTQLVDWLVGGFFQHVDRHYGQDLPTPGYDALISTPGSATNAPVDTPFYSDLSYRLKQYAAFGEATWHITNEWGLTAGVRYYKFSEDKSVLFAGAFSGETFIPGTTIPGPVNNSTDSHGFSPRFIGSFKPTNDVVLSAQASRGFRLGGINDPINLPLCSPTDRAVFGNAANWKDEKTWNYELDAKTDWLDHRVTFNAGVFYSRITDLQATTTAGTCSSRVVFNVPTARSAGVEVELFARPNLNWDFALSGTYIDAKLTSSVTSTDQNGNTVVVGGLQDGNRLPTAPKEQVAVSGGYTLPVMGAGKDFFANVTIQYVGSSFSQFENEEPGFGEICAGCPSATNPNAARLIVLGGPYSTSLITFNPELPSYTLVNLRAGLKTDHWQVAGYIDNIMDKTAELALDYERGRSARVGYLTNQPRTFGVYGLYQF